MDIFDMLVERFGEVVTPEIDNDPSLERPDLSGVADGETFEFMGIEFVRLGLEHGGVLCITKDSYHLSCFHDENQHNNYIDSNVRKWILDEFLSKAGWR